MHNHGGYIRGPWWRYRGDDEEKTRRCYVIAWGNIVKDPQDNYRYGSRSIRFVIKTGRGAGRNEKHLVCAAYGEKHTAVVMRAMEKGDIVLCCGTWNEHLNVKTKKGTKQLYEMVVNFIVPFGLITFLLDLYMLPSMHQMIAERANEDADVWESD